MFRKLMMYLFTGNKINAKYKLHPITNCTKDTDKLVVTSDGVVEFGVETEDDTAIINIS